jgi:hypothetical protein
LVSQPLWTAQNAAARATHATACTLLLLRKDFLELVDFIEERRGDARELCR